LRRLFCEQRCRAGNYARSRIFAFRRLL
jgi:hypothetical protein